MSKRIEPQATEALTAPITPRSYDSIPSDLIYGLDVCGPESIGKTHFALTHPGDISFVDTEQKAETVIPKFLSKKKINWKSCENWDDVVWTVNDALKNPSVKTIIFDTGADLQSMAAEKWCSENGKKSVYPITQFQHVYSKIDDLSGRIKKARKYLISTSRMKDEWIGDASTGRKIRDGYKRFTWDLHLAIELRYGIPDTNNKIWFPERRFARVTKNNFWGVDDNGMQFGKPYLFNVSHDGVKKELLNPWGDGVPVKDQMSKIVDEAKALYGPK